MMKTMITILLTAALSLYACTSKQPGSKQASQPPKPAGPAPDFELQNVSGGVLKSDDIKGKVTVVDFWATWCQPCIQEIPNFNKIHESHDGKGVQMLAITVESGSLDEIKPKVKQLNMKYPVVVGDDKVVEGFGGLIGFPTTFVVTQDWKIYKKYLGMTPKKRELIEKDIATLLAQPLAHPRPTD
jgi:thiol-disulfide isomerase/thioredoxin